MIVPDITDGERLFHLIFAAGEVPDESEKVEVINLIQNSMALRKVLGAILRASEEKFKQVGAGNLADASMLAQLQGLQGEARGLAQAIGVVTDLLTTKEDNENGK